MTDILTHDPVNRTIQNFVTCTIATGCPMQHVECYNVALKCSTRLASLLHHPTTSCIRVAERVGRNSVAVHACCV